MRKLACSIVFALAILSLLAVEAKAQYYVRNPSNGSYYTTPYYGSYSGTPYTGGFYPVPSAYPSVYPTPYAGYPNSLLYNRSGLSSWPGYTNFYTSPGYYSSPGYYGGYYGRGWGWRR